MNLLPILLVQDTAMGRRRNEGEREAPAAEQLEDRQAERPDIG